MSKAFQAPAILKRISTLTDGGLSLGFQTNELSVEEMAGVLHFQNKFGWVCFQENQFTDADIPDADATDESKTPSRRLRGVLFVAWRQRGATGDFEVFYRRHMEKIINRIKQALDD